MAPSRVPARVSLAIGLKIESLSNGHQIDPICKGGRREKEDRSKKEEKKIRTQKKVRDQKEE